VDWAVFVVQWLHVIMAILWFGSVLYADFVLVPAFNTLPLTVQRAAVAAIAVRAGKVIPPVAGLVIVLGILRGTVFGQIQSLTALTSAYGLTWLAGLILAGGTFVSGKRVLEPSLNRISALTDAEALNADGSPSSQLVTALTAVKRNAMLELLGFVAVFTCMILMRFGY